MKCLKCDGQYIKRKGPFGEFYGCSNFPRCRSTKAYKKITRKKKNYNTIALFMSEQIGVHYDYP